MKRHFQILAVSLITTLMINLFPGQTLATLVEDSPVIPPPYVDNEVTKPEGTIIGEVIEKRDKNTKHFMKDDLSFEADIYPFPVHYQKDGKWVDIDNTLVDGQDEEKNQILENSNNEYKVKIAKNSNSNKLIRVEKDGYEVSWSLNGSQKSISQVEPKDQKRLDALGKNDQRRTLSNLSSEINFKDINPNIDLQYFVNPEDFKENIIIKEKVDNPTFVFTLNSKGLVPKLLEDNSIVFYDAKNLSKAVFKIDAPYMYDAKNEESKNIKVILEPDAKSYKLTIIPDPEWLNSEERLYPVVLDSTLQTSLYTEPQRRNTI